MDDMVLTFTDIDWEHHECNLDIGLLYPDKQSRDRFEKKWDDFYKSEKKNHPEIFWRRRDGAIVFHTESLVPAKSDQRPPVLLLLGNPASHSVQAGMPFSFEGQEEDSREHRFWIALRETGVLRFHSNIANPSQPASELNRIRKRDFGNLEYDSPFRIGIAMYFSMPSPASLPPWAGVSGIQRLFGRKAVSAIAAAEQRRLERVVRDFLPGRGGILAFQRDAYEAIRTDKSPEYSLVRAQRGELVGRCRYDHRIHLMGVPPTRYFHTHEARNTLSQLRARLVHELER